MHGILTNFKFLNSNTLDSDYFYEITTKDDTCYYLRSNSNGNNKIITMKYGDEVQIKSENYINTQMDTSNYNKHTELPAIIPSHPVLGPFSNNFKTVNYQGFILDCLDQDFGVYNLDNEIILFASGCIEFEAIRNSNTKTTFYNLHLVQMEDMSWILKLFGRYLKNSTHILVFCPSFSSYSKDGNEVYENIVSTKSNFSSLIYSYFWLKNLKIEKGLKLKFPGFKSLDDLASILIQNNNSSNNSNFERHCQSCAFTDNFIDLNDLILTKKIIFANEIKSYFHSTKSKLLNSTIYSNQVLSKVTWLNNEILFGTIHRKNSILFDLKSGENSISIYCNDLTFNPPQNIEIFIFNPLQILEIVPKLKCANSWTTKAYLWISPNTKVWSFSGYFWSSLSSNNENENFPDFIKCKITRKYFILKEFEGKQFETAVIHVESSQGPRCFHLNPTEKFYAILPENEKNENESNNLIDEIFSITFFINENYFKDYSNSIPVISSSSIIPTVICNLQINPNDKNNKGAIQVRLNDLPYLSYLKGVQFFSLKLRFYSPSSLSLKLICSKCQKLIIAGNCLTHSNSENFIPLLTVSAVFDTADSEGNHCNVLIDRFSVFESILNLNSVVKTHLIQILKTSGHVKLESEHFSFINYIKPIEKIENIVAQLLPRISKVCLCTFPVNMAKSVLRPVNLEICETKSEILNLLNYFNLNKE